ncbi:MAG: hypothetical protein IT565_11235 [Rhodospirillales bacterium]|nr:hypothetical protein [Rhodospirillales bacterium]
MTAILKLMAALVEALVRFAPLFPAWRAGRRAAQAQHAQTGATMPARPFALTKRSLVFLTAISNASCATQEQIVAHNRKADRFCR